MEPSCESRAPSAEFSITIALTAAQQAAIAHIETHALARRESAQRLVQHVRKMSNVSSKDLEEAIGQLETHARVGLHFHPDRLDPVRRSVAGALLEDGLYQSQFVTRLSNGKLSPDPGGPRDIWENRLFGGAYGPGTERAERPKYGALALMGHADGPSPRFGSCFFLLKPAVSQRCTFTYMDSNDLPDERGTLAVFDGVFCGLLIECFERVFALGRPDVTPSTMIQHLRTELARPLADLVTGPPARNLDHYIEAQVHGDVRLERDVEALIADPSFRGSETGDMLEGLSARYGIQLFWHAGFCLRVGEIPMDFRGPSMPSLAQRVAENGSVHAREIGQAAASLHRDPAAWEDRGSHAEVLQELKLLWHVLLRYGKPMPPPAR